MRGHSKRALFCALVAVSCGHAHALLDTRVYPRPCTAAGERACIRRAPARSSLVSLRGGEAAVPAGGSGGESFIAQQWNRYLTALTDRPIPTKMASAAVLSGLGDLIAQYIEGAGATGFAMKRFIVLVAVNVIYIAPLLHCWYGLFERIVHKMMKLKEGTWKATLSLLCFDQLLNAPTTIAGFFTVFAIANTVADAVTGVPFAGFGALADSVMGKLRVEYVGALITNWQVWVLPQLFNFAVVPSQLRVGFANIVAIVWNVILSIIANR